MRMMPTQLRSDKCGNVGSQATTDFSIYNGNPASNFILCQIIFNFVWTTRNFHEPPATMTGTPLSFEREPEDWDTESDTEAAPVVLNLVNRICREFVESKFPDDAEPQLFLPDGKIDELITEESVARELELENEPTPGNTRLIAFICQSAKKVFASALLSGLNGKVLRKVMSNFRRNRFDDRSLPVGPEFDTLPFVCYSDSPWLSMQCMYFKSSQWRFMTPVFVDPDSGKELTMILKKGDIFPFTFVHEQKREGTFGNVYQVTIHTANQVVPMTKVSSHC